MPAANDKAVPKKRKDKDPAPVPKVPASAILVARIGGTLAMIPAAAISAQTLFRLGRMMNLPPSIAWLLPAALDIYAVTSIWVGFQVPEGHKARTSAIWNARFALALSVVCNALSHALDLAGAKHGWSRRDLALTLVSALPPIVVERLLHLQTMIASESATDTATAAATPAAQPETVAAPATPTAAPVVAKVATTLPATTAHSQTNGNANPAASNSNPPAKLIGRPQRLKIVRALIVEHGVEVPLAVIQEAVGGDKSTASRLRADALKPSKAEPEDLDAEPERVLQAAGAGT